MEAGRLSPSRAARLAVVGVALAILVAACGNDSGGDQADRPVVLTAWRADGGAVRWQARGDGPSLVAAGVVDRGVVYAVEGKGCSPLGLAAREARDGSERWRSNAVPGAVPVGAPRDGVLVVRTTGGVAGIDATSGDRRWAVQDAVLLGEGDAVLVANGDRRRVRLLDRRTGKQRWSFPLTGGEVAAWGLVASPVAVVGVYGTGGDPGAQVTRAYALADGAPRWTTTLVPGSDVETMRALDGVITGAAPDGSGLVALDAATGETRWQLPDAVPAQGLEPASGRFLAFGTNPNDLLGVDARTGAVAWRVPPGADWPPLGAGDSLVVGREVRSVRTGAVTGRLAPPPAETGDVTRPFGGDGLVLEGSNPGCG